MRHTKQGVIIYKFSFCRFMRQFSFSGVLLKQQVFLLIQLTTITVLSNWRPCATLSVKGIATVRPVVHEKLAETVSIWCCNVSVVTDLPH